MKELCCFTLILLKLLIKALLFAFKLENHFFEKFIIFKFLLYYELKRICEELDKIH